MQRNSLLDWPLLIIGLVLSVCGLVLVYSATWEPRGHPGFYASGIFIKQLIALLIALAVFHFMRRVKWGLKPASWAWFYLPVMALLLVVDFVGHSSGANAQRWIDLGIFKLQPSEPAKMAWVMLLAWLFSAAPQQLRRNYFIALALLFSFVGLILKQPDLGTSMVFVFTFFVMAWLAPVPRSVIRATLVCFVIGALIAYPFLRLYQQNRVLAMLNLQRVEVVEQIDEPDNGTQITEKAALDWYENKVAAAADKGRTYSKPPPKLGDVILKRASSRGTKYQQIQGTIAVGSGGVMGKGFLRGTQNKQKFVPVPESDFIFSVAGEEFGFVGSLFIVVLLLVLISRILALAAMAHTTYERYICYGASAVILFHTFFSVGMTMKLVPVVGVPLPFMSQGGSALISFWAMLAVLESIHEKSQGEYLNRRRP